MKRLTAVVLSLFFLFGGVLPAYAQQNNSDQRVVVVGSEELIEKDFFLGAGDTVRVAGKNHGYLLYCK